VTDAHRKLGIVALLALLMLRGGCDSVPFAPSQGVTQATYVYEKDDTAVPGAVQFALNRLNRERKIVATLFEDDTTDGMGEVPDQYKVALKAAQDAGLPALVVQAGDKVVRVVKDPKTEAEVMEAAR